MYYLKCKSLNNQKYLEINAITCRRRNQSIAKLKKIDPIGNHKGLSKIRVVCFSLLGNKQRERDNTSGAAIQVEDNIFLELHS